MLVEMKEDIAVTSLWYKVNSANFDYDDFKPWSPSGVFGWFHVFCLVYRCVIYFCRTLWDCDCTRMLPGSLTEQLACPHPNVI
jgi:hypothetical protein